MCCRAHGRQWIEINRKSDESRLAWTQEQQHLFGQEISAKTVPRRRQSATASKNSKPSCQPRGTVSPHEIARCHHSRCEDASDTRTETFDECCGHERCLARCNRVKSELLSAQRDSHGHEIHQKQGPLRDRCRYFDHYGSPWKAPHNGVRPNKREFIAAAVDTPMEISIPSAHALRSDTQPEVEMEQANRFESEEPVNARLLRAPWEPTKEEKEVHEKKGGHAQVRPWCRSCLAGAGSDRAHARVERPDERAIPVQTTV